MDAVIAFYTSTDPKITLSTKLLEVVFVLNSRLGLSCATHFGSGRFCPSPTLGYPFPEVTDTFCRVP